jgi:hypothetical protein
MGERAAGAQQRRAAGRLHLVFADRPGRLGQRLRENNGNVNALGLFDLDRKIRPVGIAYKELVRDWMEVLPTQSVCLQVPIVMPGSARGRRLLLGLRKRGGRPYHGGEQDQSSDFHVILQRVNKKILNEFYPQTHLFSCHGLEFVACPAGFEPATLSLEVKGFGH